MNLLLLRIAEAWLESYVKRASNPAEHPNYTPADYQYLKGQGRSDSEIVALWDQDMAENRGPVTKAPKPQHTPLETDQAVFQNPFGREWTHSRSPDTQHRPLRERNALPSVDEQDMAHFKRLKDLDR